MMHVRGYFREMLFRRALVFPRKIFLCEQGGFANLRIYLKKKEHAFSIYFCIYGIRSVHSRYINFQCEYQLLQYDLPMVFFSVVFMPCIGSHSSLHNSHILWVLCMITHNSSGRLRVGKLRASISRLYANKIT